MHLLINEHVYTHGRDEDSDCLPVAHSPIVSVLLSYLSYGARPLVCFQHFHHRTRSENLFNIEGDSARDSS